MSDPSDKALAQADTIGRAFIEVLGDPAISWRARPTAEFTRAVATRARELDAAKGGALLTNPHTGTPRDYRDVESDPAGILIHKAGEPLYATPPAQAAEAVYVEQLCRECGHATMHMGDLCFSCTKKARAAIAAMQAGG